MNNWLASIADVQLPRLARGSHDTPEQGLCAMEMVAYMERLEHTDSPACVCSTLAQYVRALNDAAKDEERQLLWPYLSRLVGTTTNANYEEERLAYMYDSAYETGVQLLGRFGRELSNVKPIDRYSAVHDIKRSIGSRFCWTEVEHCAYYIAANLLELLEVPKWCISVPNMAVAIVHHDMVKALDILDGALRIGPPARGFSNPQRLRELIHEAP